jgi:hypothetical protein
LVDNADVLDDNIQGMEERFRVLEKEELPIPREDESPTRIIQNKRGMAIVA